MLQADLPLIISSCALWKISEHFPETIMLIMQIMLIMLNVIKTKSTNVNRVKYIFYSKNYKTNENKNIFI